MDPSLLYFWGFAFVVFFAVCFGLIFGLRVDNVVPTALPSTEESFSLVLPEDRDAELAFYNHQSVGKQVFTRKEMEKRPFSRISAYVFADRAYPITQEKTNALRLPYLFVYNPAYERKLKPNDSGHLRVAVHLLRIDDMLQDFEHMPSLHLTVWVVNDANDDSTSLDPKYCLYSRSIANLVYHPRVKKVWLQNYIGDLHGGKISRMPLGISNLSAMRNEINGVAAKLRGKRERKILNTLAHHRRKLASLWIEERNRAIAALQSGPTKSLVVGVRGLYETHLWQRHANVMFDACPAGNGLDTHRFWEAITLGTVPVVSKENPLWPLYESVGALVIDKWENLRPETILSFKATKIDPTKASTKYWIAQMSAE